MCHTTGFFPPRTVIEQQCLAVIAPFSCEISGPRTVHHRKLGGDSERVSRGLILLKLECNTAYYPEHGVKKGMHRRRDNGLGKIAGKKAPLEGLAFNKSVR